MIAGTSAGDAQKRAAARATAKPGIVGPGRNTAVTEVAVPAGLALTSRRAIAEAAVAKWSFIPRTPRRPRRPATTD